MADSFIQLPADSTGKQLDTVLVNMGAGTTAVHREKVVLSDPASTTGFATVTSSAGLLASLSSGTVSLSSQISVTATAATNPWSSAPGFNVPVVSVSSGLVQLSSQITVTATGPVTITSGTVTLSSVPTIFSASSGGVQAFIPISPTSSVAGAGFGPVTSSAGVLATISSGTISLSSQITVTATGPVTVTSGIVTLSSVHTVTATAGTNPWSSAPGFNVPVVNVSSGLVQISGTPLVNVVGTSSGVAVVTTSGGLVVQATGPFGTVTVLSASSGLVQVSGVPLIAVTSSVMSLITIGTTGPASVLVTSSGGPVFSAGVNTAAGYGPVTSSYGRLVSQTTASIPSVINASSANPTPVIVASSVALVSTYFFSTGGAASVNVRGSASYLLGYSYFNTTATIRSIKIYNTSAAPTIGATANLLLPLVAPGSTGGGGANLSFPLPGLLASNGIGFTMTANAAATDTGAPGLNDLVLTLYFV